MFYHIIVYKHEKDMLRMLDIELFQNRILEVFMPDFRSQTTSEKEATLREYLKTVADNYDEAEMVLEDKDGYIKAGLGYGKLENDEDKQEEEIWKRKKKKKEQVFNDFYKFQRKAANDRKALTKKKADSDEEGDDNDDDDDFGVEDPLGGDYDVEQSDNDVPENGLEDPEYLKKRKQVLANSFQEQLAALNKKKLKTL